MSISIAIPGSSKLAKRLIAAIGPLSELLLTESESADVLVDCDSPPKPDKRIGPADNLSPSLSGPVVRHSQTYIQLPTSDSCTILRVLKALHGFGNLKRCFAKVITRTARATGAGWVDGLQPTFEDSVVASELTSAFNSPNSEQVHFVARRVIASYTHSHLCHLKLDFDNKIDRETMVSALKSAPRIIVGSATQDGITTTAHLQEFFRDLGRPGGERPELFIWEESVLCDENSLHLMVDHSPDCLLVPEVIDAIRQLDNKHESAQQISRSTDKLLGLWHDLRGPMA